MDITITARHCELPDSIRRRTQDRFQRLTRFDGRVIAADVIFDIENGQKQVEARVRVAGEPVLTARGKSDSFRGALDRTVDRIGRQIKRRHERHRDHQAAKLSEVAEPPESDT